MVKLAGTRSHSRPKTSNDNPYSEAQFRTLKYDPWFPEKFDSRAHAHEFAECFFDYYNHIHRHSGIGLHPPASVHHGTAEIVQTRREATPAAAYRANPARFARKPVPPPLPTTARINEPADPETPHPAAQPPSPPAFTSQNHPLSYLP